MPLSFAPGDAYQFDWSHDQVEISGKPMTVKVAHLRLYHMESAAPSRRSGALGLREIAEHLHDRAMAADPWPLASTKAPAMLFRPSCPRTSIISCRCTGASQAVIRAQSEIGDWCTRAPSPNCRTFRGAA